MAYAVDLAELLRRMADDVQTNPQRSKPGDIPILSAHQIRAPDQPVPPWPSKLSSAKACL